MHFNGDLTKEPSALDRCAIYALRKNSEAAYQAFFACGGTNEKVTQLAMQLKQEKKSYVEPDPSQLKSYEQLKERGLEDLLLLSDRKEKEITVIAEAYLETHPTIEKVIDLFASYLGNDLENKKTLCDRLEGILYKMLSRLDLPAALSKLKERNLLHDIAVQAITKKHHGLLELIVSSHEDKFILAKEAIKSKNVQALKLLFEIKKGNSLKDNVDSELFLLSCETGDEEAVRFFLEKKGNGFQLRDSQALLLALKSGNIKLIELLVSFGSPIPDAKELIGLPQLLLDAIVGAELRYNKTDFTGLKKILSGGDSPLRQAVMSGDLKELEALLQKGAPIHKRDEEGLTPLHHAAVQGNQQAIQLLLKYGASVHICDFSGKLPIDHAISSNNCKTIQSLVDGGADCEEKNGIGNTSLAQALLSPSLKLSTVKYLVEKCGADINALCGADPENEKGNGIPLLSRAACYHLEILQFLLEKGAEVNPGQITLFDLFYDAAIANTGNFTKYTKEINLLSSYGAKCSRLHGKKTNDQYADEYLRTGTTSLHKACKDLDLKAVAQELKKDAPVNCRDSEGRTPLHLLLMQRPADTKAIELLIKKGASIAAQDHQGLTPLHIAAREGLSDDIINLLLTSRPDAIDIQDNLGRTALHWASLGGKENVIKSLVNKKASLTIADKQDLLPYHLLTKYYPVVAEGLYNQFNPIPGIGFKIWQQVCEFYILEKLLCHRFSLESSYVNSSGEIVKLQGFFSEVTLEELAKSAERNAVYAQFAPSLRQANEMLKAMKVGDQTLRNEVDKAFQSNIIPVSTGWQGHATGMVLSKTQHLTLKANRGEGTEEKTSGLRIFEMKNLSNAKEEVVKSVNLKNQKSGMPHFQNGMDIPMGLREISNRRMRHKGQKVGNCSWVSAKLLLRGSDYLSRLDAKSSHYEAAKGSHAQYKQFTKEDRLSALQDFLVKAKALDQDVKSVVSEHVLPANGIIPQQILRELMFKCIRKNQNDYLKLILEFYPELLASLENGTSVLKMARGNPEALVMIKECLYNNQKLFFPLCIEKNNADCLEYLLSQFPEWVDGEWGRNQIQQAFNKGHYALVAVLVQALRSLKLDQCMTMGLRLFDCNDQTVKFLNKISLTIFLTGGKTIEDLLTIVNKSKSYHLKGTNVDLQKAVKGFCCLENETVFDYLLKNPMEIRKPDHYLLKVQEVHDKPVPKSQGEKSTVVPEHHFYMHDAFLQIVSTQALINLINRYGTISKEIKNPKTLNTLSNNLIMMLERRIMYKNYDQKSCDKEIALLVKEIEKHPGLKEAIVKKNRENPNENLKQLTTLLNAPKK